MDQSHKRLTTISRTAGIAGAALGGALFLGARAGFKEMEEGQKATAQTNAVLKSTGGIAKVTAGHVKDLAQSILNKSGIDDEAVQSGENMLLTFKNIRNEVGAGNKIFDQTTKVLVDMSTALTHGHVTGESLSKTAIQLGKAMNDPIKGMTALRRVGVTFSEDQVKLITHLVNTGQTMQAQKVILHELNSEFGGSAQALGKTLPGQMSIAREQFKNLAAEITHVLLPAFIVLTGWALKMTTWLQDHQRLTKILVVALGILSASLLTLSVALKVARVAQLLLNVAVLANPYVAAAVAVIALGVAVYVFRDKIINTYNWIKDHWPLLAGIIGGPLGLAIAELIKHWGGLVSAIQPAINAMHGIASAIKGVVHWLQRAVDLVGALIGALGKIHVPHISIPHIGLPGIGGPGGGGGSGAAEGSAFHVGKQLWDEIGMGEKFGLRVTSGYRPGAVTTHGTPSDHGYNPSRAVDMSGSPYGMAALFNALIGRREIRQAFYDPLGSIFNGVRSSYREGGHSDHIHVAEYAKGGIVTKATHALIGEAGPEAVVPLSGLSTGGSWQNRYFNFMQRVWQFARPYFPNAMGPMPPVRFTDGLDSLFVGTDFTPDARGNIPPPGQRTLYWPRWLSFFANRNKAVAAYETLIHEWAHEFQDVKATSGIRLGEGGAEAFAEAHTPAIYRGLGFNIKPAEVKGIMGNYYGYVKWVLANKGMNWVNKGQFGVFDKGGWLQPGLTMAYNGTGQPERVGGGDVIIPVSIGGEHVATVVFDMLRRKAKVFENRNGRPAFGGA